ncbi:MAG: mechanosensitive ion channel [Saprospiraceae bacterium]|nr:mechanosensitive ion channel [Saprospiraceae bacterium]MCB0627414.1 mechanosensitive ion channel [Saprospiraceae bacterium]MCB0675483.1 mechanosensitive ion channel [Saprospiraceae bacterium]MCB0681067.1 mechanosensitive ion channel [Saprospiraceae bacterium]
MTFTEFLDQNLKLGSLEFTVFDLLAAFIILAATRLIVWLITHVVLRRLFRRRDVDIGRQYVTKRLVMYVVYTLGILLAMETVGISLSVIWAGSAALLVGLGLGLQQTFNDLVSGLIIMIEGTLEIGDVVVVDGFVARVSKIGLRTSTVITRDDTSIIVPNSKLTLNNVTNWSHSTTATRFQVRVGVAYSSDVRLVEKLLLEAANNHSKVLKKPKPSVQFSDFGNSSLDFTLQFFSRDIFPIEYIKSDLRFAITELFRQNGVEIPFPQRDLWLRNPDALK